mmetsp:Transcript_23605/g.67501  ORF Transcript_23605/g.67501 Transcript_23605/m.67501 type:complete len:246 (+) Transcript_23605:2075-2812(+)
MVLAMTVHKSTNGTTRSAPARPDPLQDPGVRVGEMKAGTMLLMLERARARSLGGARLPGGRSRQLSSRTWTACRNIAHPTVAVQREAEAKMLLEMKGLPGPRRSRPMSLLRERSGHHGSSPVQPTAAMSLPEGKSFSEASLPLSRQQATDLIERQMALRPGIHAHLQQVAPWRLPLPGHQDMRLGKGGMRPPLTASPRLRIRRGKAGQDFLPQIPALSQALRLIKSAGTSALTGTGTLGRPVARR